jgi:predicted nucleic acid-binding protein
MKVLVSDTSALIDLEHGDLLEVAFACGHQLIVPDLLYQNELEPHGGDKWKNLGLVVVDLTPAEVQFAQDVNTARPTLTLADCFALSCARRPDHILITGDKSLRNEAVAHKIPMHGVLWLLDELQAAGGIPVQVLIDGLTKIVARANCRLPRDEIRKRLEAWTKLI